MVSCSRKLWLAVVGAATVLAASLLVFWNPAGNFWKTVESPKAQCEAYDASHLAATSSLTESVYDKRKLERLVREPENTLSNLAYFIVGLAVLGTAQSTLQKSFAWAILVLAIGSGIYHASLLPEWRLVDIIGVYTTLISLIAVGWDSLRTGPATERPPPGNNVGRFALAALMWILSCAAAVFRNDVRIAGLKILDSTYVVVATVALISLLALLATLHRSSRHSVLLFALFLLAGTIAAICGFEDRFGHLLARPAAPIQGHAIWHTSGAIALFFAAKLFATSTTSPASKVQA